MANVRNAVPMPALPTEFPELKDMPAEMLEQLEVNQSALDEFVSNLSILEKYRTMTRQSDDQSIRSAQTNTDAMAASDIIRGEIEMLVKQLQDAKKRAEESFTERDAVLLKFTPKSLLKDLNDLAESTDQETEKIISEFTSLEPAKAAILQQRILHHKAKALADLIAAHSGSRLGTSPKARK